MTDSRPRSPLSRLAVLAVSHHGVEWYERDPNGTVRYGSHVPPGTRPPDIVAAAVEARRAAGGGRRRCVLALDHTLSRHRLIGLPPVAKKELPRIFERKARQLLELAEGPVYYSALPMGEEEGERGREKQWRWLLTALDAESIRDLCLRLRGHGFHVHRVVSRSLAALAHAQAEAGVGDEPLIVVTVDHGIATVSLAAGDELVYRDRIEGDILTEPALATSVVQLVRTCAAYWRKHHRGQQVRRVLVLGMPVAQGRLLSHAIAPIIEGGTVDVLPREGDDEKAGRFAFLEATSGTGRLCPELAFPLPSRRFLTAVLGLAFLVASGILAWTVHGNATAELRDLQLDTASLNTTIAALAPFAVENRRIEDGVAGLNAYLGRAAAVGSHGVDLEGLLDTILAAFAGRAELTEIAVGPAADGGHEIGLRGEADPDPARVLCDLEEIRRSLESDPGIARVDLRLPARLPDAAGGRAEPFVFEIQARVEVPQ
ncbi:MAG: hypothetical protein AB1726_04710 [Planctomycetota bacterium]